MQENRQYPNAGEFVQARGRLWLVEGAPADATGTEAGGIAKTPVSGSGQLLRTFQLACTDDDAQGEVAEVVWDVEISPELDTARRWAEIGTDGADDAASFAAYVQTIRWNSATAADRRLLQSPFRAGIRMSPYQLAPLEKALKLPRVNLLIADDVGLGKTIEAGLVVRELLLRRRLDFFIVAAPPSMTVQWRDELAQKFGIAATIVDREHVAQIRRRRGFGANPWATGAAFIVSHRLLAEESYMAGLRERLSHLSAKTLLVLDEAHHAAPAGGGRYAIDSQFTRAVRELAPRFEHRLFLSATPHNGHSNSFSALLEMLDPQRFTRGIPASRKELEAVMVRRLKSDLRALDEQFPERVVEAVPIRGLPQDDPELVLAAKLSDYGELRERRLSRLPPKEAAAARLVFSGLQQRLLSSIAAFAKTLEVHRRSLEKTRKRRAVEAGSAAEAIAEAYATGETTPEDLLEGDDEGVLLARISAEDAAAAEAATDLGARDAADADLEAEIALVDDMLAIAQANATRPDARVRWLQRFVDEHLKRGGAWGHRRLIVFTEFEDTRTWLEKRLLEAIGEDRHGGRIRAFTGATPSPTREELKRAFNAPPDEDPLRILVCTDAAREGINLQRRCHDLVHFDLPWNPSRIEQRNGRIDRKLQPEPRVYCRYFVYEQREIDVVLKTLVRKTETIRGELGAIGKVIEDRLVSRLAGGVGRGRARDLAEALEREDGGQAVERAREEMDDATDKRRKRLAEETDRLRRVLERSRERVGVDPRGLSNVAFAALARAGVATDALAAERVGDVETFALDPADPAFGHDHRWTEVLDELRVRPRKPGERVNDWRRNAPVRRIAFEPATLPDGRDPEDVVQLHLEHRLVRRLLSRFVAHGFQKGLERTCVLLSDDARPRVVFLGRVCLFGPGAARLHEEIIPVAALWHEKDRADRPLKPLSETGDAAHVTFDELQRALGEAREAPDHVVARCAAFAGRDAEALRPAFEERADARARRAESELEKLGEAEAAELEKLLRDQLDRIEKNLAEPDQLALDLEDERRQRERDRRHWEARRETLRRDVEAEPARVRAQYAVQARRLEPVGVVYLWPRTG